MRRWRSCPETRRARCPRRAARSHITARQRRRGEKNNKNKRSRQFYFKVIYKSDKQMRSLSASPHLAGVSHKDKAQQQCSNTNSKVSTKLTQPPKTSVQQAPIPSDCLGNYPHSHPSPNKRVYTNYNYDKPITASQRD